MKVAVVGMGRMGAAMAKRLAENGFEVVVHNRTRAKAEAVADRIGAQVTDTAAEAAAAGEMVVSSLTDDAAVVDTYRKPGGLVEGLRRGTVVIETSTVDPRTVESLENEVAARGATLLDAPVSGSVPAVETGTLTFMVGGEPAALEKARPVLEVLGAKIFHVGRVGAGATVKLAVNSIVHALNVALAEALVLAERAGVDRKKAYEVFASSAAAAPFVHYKRAAFEDPENAGVAFSLDLVAKDLDLIVGLARRVGAEMTQAETTRRVAGQAIEAGYGQSDMSAVASYLRSKKP